MNQSFPDSKEASDLVPIQIYCISKTSSKCTAPLGSNFDPYAVLFDLDGAIRDIGPYKTFIQIILHEVHSIILAFLNVLLKLEKSLMQKLCSVNLNLLTYKQKLAFWINIKIRLLQAFLVHGLPSTQEKLLLLMNKAVVNVGGVVVNALGIENYILRNPSNSNPGPANEREIPEPNVTFALCRGSWSSPALRVYTADDIVNELVKARLESAWA
ncbi:hypothetical protein HanPI659440_Chr07g0273461 [Helianthus annuus]|nr:hypothetical protein HanPI659440_Chr07g0273461 [Helianthus annuus]